MEEEKKIFKVRGDSILVSNGIDDIYISNIHKGGKGESIMRPSPLSNPNAIGFNGDRQEVLKKYRSFLYEKIRQKDKQIINELQRLYIKWETNRQLTLQCCCAPALCHGEVIAELLIKEKEKQDGRDTIQ